MSTVAFIHARAGSKGCPGKNTRMIGGQPLIAHTIAQAKRHPLIDQVIVSTDCNDAIGVARSFEVDWIVRPPALCTDEALEFMAWKHSVAAAKMKHDDIFVNLPCTCPFRSDLDISKVLMSIDDYARVAFTVKRIREFIIERGSCPEPRRQDLPPRIAVVGACYAATARFIWENESIFDGIYMTVDIDEERALDIDTEHDFKIAKLLMESQ